MATRIEGYVDTSALIAFADRSDTHHLTFRRLFSDPPALLTSTLVVAEGHAWFLRRYDRTRALQFLAMVDDMSPMSVAAVGHDEQTKGAAILRRYSDQDMTLTDAVGLHLMAAKRIPFCWSTDFHLAITGVPLVIDQP
jgi:predicted nucleic acid-binding protein